MRLRQRKRRRHQADGLDPCGRSHLTGITTDATSGEFQPSSLACRRAYPTLRGPGVNQSFHTTHTTFLCNHSASATLAYACRPPTRRGRLQTPLKQQQRYQHRQSISPAKRTGCESDAAEHSALHPRQIAEGFELARLIGCPRRSKAPLRACRLIPQSIHCQISNRPSTPVLLQAFEKATHSIGDGPNET